MAIREALTPSFRNRLRLFFLVIVIIPMIAVATVLWQLIAQSDRGQADAQLYQAGTVAERVSVDEVKRAQQVAKAIGEDQELANALADENRSELQTRLDELAERQRARYVALDLGDLGMFASGNQPAMAPATLPLVDEDDARVGTLTVSVASPEEYGERVNDLTVVELQLRRDGEVLWASDPLIDRPLPDEKSVDVDGEPYRATTREAPSVAGPVTAQLVLEDAETGVSHPNSYLAIGGMAIFLLIAFGFAIAVSRRLQAEVQRLLEAAQRLGRGDFRVAVPTEGNDEFAALGKEFNSMARQLETRLAELQRERGRLQEAIRRVGESFAKGLDRIGLLEIVVQTAVDGIGAAGGRATMRPANGGNLREIARAGDPTPMRRALHAAEAAVIDAGQLAEIQIGGLSALAAPLGSKDEGEPVIGIVSVAREDRAFSPAERELFSYLTNQASVSVENQDLHETVQRQAVTDELTGLFNHRRFQEVMGIEVERARRYGHEISLIMLDIDNFKQVNDTHGHLQGDMVLGEVARILRDSSREIDEPARYGGEEMAVALPQTDLEGAYQFAERVRRRIEALEIPLPDDRDVLRVTASFGVASLGAAGDMEKDALVAAADAALYGAKRTGKNRTVRAPSVHGVASTE